jgi:hypothetical protein
MVLGEPIHVARDSDDAALAAAREAVGQSLDEVHKRAYALVGTPDPGLRTGQREPA